MRWGERYGDVSILLFRGDQRLTRGTREMINKESRAAPRKVPRLDSRGRRKYVFASSLLPSVTLESIDLPFSWQTHVLFAYLIVLLSSHRFSSSFRFFFFFFFPHSRSLFRPFTVALPCPVTMIDRLCQDRAASDAHARFPGWRNDESGVLN